MTPAAFPYHAWSGARRVPLQPWQVQPFSFTLKARRPVRIAAIKPGSIAPASRALKIIQSACDSHHVALREVLSVDRTARVVVARDDAMWRLRTEMGMSLVQIGLRLGGRDHSTVLSGLRRHEERRSARAAA